MQSCPRKTGFFCDYERLTMIIKMRGSSGFTLAELLVATFVLVVGVLSALLFFSNAMNATQYAGDVTEATSHGEYVLEEMKTRTTLANIAGTNWSAWVTGESIYSLPGESITVAITNAQANPLDIDLDVSWTRKSRTNNVSLRTRITK